MKSIAIGLAGFLFWQTSLLGQTLPGVSLSVRGVNKVPDLKVAARNEVLDSVLDTMKKEAEEMQRLRDESKAVREAVLRIQKAMEKNPRIIPLLDSNSPLPRQEPMPAGDYDYEPFRNTHG